VGSEMCIRDRLIITKDFLDDFFIAFDEANKYHMDFKDFLTTHYHTKLPRRMQRL